MRKTAPTAVKRGSLDEARKADLLVRLKTVRGVTEAIHRMVEDDVYCIEVIKQISAARAGLDRVARLLLENHVSHCFVEAVRAGDEDAAVAELMDTLALHKELV